MSADESDLQFIRCPGCRSLVPAVATRCRMCGQLLEPKTRSANDALNKKSRVRQRTMSVSEDERDLLKDQVISGEFDDDADLLPVDDSDEIPPGVVEAQDADDFPVDADPYEELPEDVRGFAERGDRGGTSTSLETSAAEHNPTLEESWSFDENIAVLELSDAEDDADDHDDYEEDGDEVGDQTDSQPVAKKRRRRKRKKKGSAGADDLASNVSGTANASPQSQRSVSSTAVSSTAAPAMSGPAMSTPPRGIGWNRPDSSSSQRGVSAPENGGHQRGASGLQEQKRQPEARANAHRQLEQRLSGNERRAPRTSSEQIGEVAEAGAGELVGWLVYGDANGNATSRELHGGQFFVSRERLRPQDVVFGDPTVSMPQCLIFAHEHGGVTVQDLMSEHGTFLRKFGESEFRRQQGQFRVEHGDSLRFGELEIMLCLIPNS